MYVNSEKPIGNFILVNPEEEPRKEKGPCFSIRADDNGCFSISSSEGECFYIKSDEEEKPKKPPNELDTPMLEIKCVQTHGDTNITVIGKATIDGVDDVPVIAELLAVPNEESGVDAILGITRYTKLSEMGIDYEDVERLDGWDISSEVSSICIVAAGDTYWINPATLTVSSDDTGFTKKATSNPYFEEDLFKPTDDDTWWSDSPYLYTVPNDFCADWQLEEDEECFESKPCDPWRCDECRHAGVEYEVPNEKITAYSRHDESSTDTEHHRYWQRGKTVRFDEVSQPETYYSIYGDANYIKYRRDGISIDENGKIVIDLKSGSFHTHYITCIDDGVGRYHFEDDKFSAGAYVDISEIPEMPTIANATGVKIQQSFRYVSSFDGSDFQWTSKYAPFRTGSKQGVNHSLYKDHVLSADGTGKLKQEALWEEE